MVALTDGREISRYGAVFERTFIFDAFATDWLVEDPVESRPVSPGKFPLRCQNREID